MRLRVRGSDPTIATMLHRRDLLGAFTAYALLAEISSARLARRTPSARAWLDRQEELARALASGTLGSEAWRREVEVLGREADVERLVAEALPSSAVRALPTDPTRRILRWRGPDGRPLQQRYAVALFRFDRGNVITPHGHRGMQSAHLVIEGSLRARTYDRLGETSGALVLRRPRGRNAARAAPRLRGVGATIRHPLRGQSFQSRRYQGRLFTSSPSGPIFFLMSVIDQPVSAASVSASLLRRSRSRSR